MSSQQPGGSNAIVLPVIVEIDAATKAVSVLRQTTEREMGAAAAATARAMTSVEQTATSSMASATKATVNFKSELRGAPQAISAMTAAISTFGSTANPVINGLTRGLVSLLSTGLNPVGVALGIATVGAGLFADEMERVSPVIAAAEERLAALRKQISGLRLDLEAGEVGRPSSELALAQEVEQAQKRLNDLLAERRTLVREIEFITGRGEFDAPEATESRLVLDKRLRLQRITEELAATNKLRDAAQRALELGTQLREETKTRARSSSSGASGALAEAVQFQMRASNYLNEPAILAEQRRRDELTRELDADRDALMRQMQGSLPWRSNWGLGPTSEQFGGPIRGNPWRVGADEMPRVPGMIERDQFLEAGPEVKHASVFTDMRDGARESIQSGIADALANPTDVESALVSFLDTLRRSLAEAAAAGLVDGLFRAQTESAEGGWLERGLGLVSSLFGKLGVGSPGGSAGSAADLLLPGQESADVGEGGFSNWNAPKAESFRSAKSESIYVVMAPDEATADALVSKASGTGARAVVAKASGNGVARGVIPPRRRR